MKFDFRTNYEECSYKDLVDKIVRPPQNEEAAAYLLHNRYDPLMKSVYLDLTKNFSWYDDCVSDLFIHLKGKNYDWYPLATFEWRCSLGCWLAGVAKRSFKVTLAKVKPNKVIIVSVDEDTPNGKPIQLPDGGEDEHNRLQRKIALLEAISQLKNDNQKFIVLKRLQGYNSKEIAELLKKKWEKHNIKLYNSKNELVVPNPAYVDSCMQHAKAVLKITIVELI